MKSLGEMKKMSEALLVNPTKKGMREPILCNDELDEPSDEVVFSTQTLERLKSIQKVIC